MRLLAKLFQRRREEQQLAALARELSDSACLAVWNRVRERIFSMPQAEARGYLRARAAAPIGDRAAAISTFLDLSAAAQQRLIQRATDHVVGRILSDLAAGGSAARRAA